MPKEKVDCILIVASGADKDIERLVRSIGFDVVMISAYDHFGRIGLDASNSIISLINIVGEHHKVVMLKDWCHGSINWLIPYVSHVVVADLARREDKGAVIGSVSSFVTEVYNDTFSSP